MFDGVYTDLFNGEADSLISGEIVRVSGEQMCMRAQACWVRGGVVVGCVRRLVVFGKVGSGMGWGKWGPASRAR